MRVVDGIAGIHQLAKHFLIGENLTGIGANTSFKGSWKRELLNIVWR